MKTYVACLFCIPQVMPISIIEGEGHVLEDEQTLVSGNQYDNMISLYYTHESSNQKQGQCHYFTCVIEVIG